MWPSTSAKHFLGRTPYATLMLLCDVPEHQVMIEEEIKLFFLSDFSIYMN